MLDLRNYSAVCLLAGLAAANAADLDYEMSPLGLVVAPSSENPQSKIRDLLEGGLVYDATFRNPDQVVGPVTVECDEIQSIGMAFLLRKPQDRPSATKIEDVRHVWTHSDLDIRHRRLDRTQTKILGRKETEKLDVVTLDIDRKFKANGVWTLRTYVRNDLVAEAAFELVNCDSGLDVIDVPEAEKVAEAPTPKSDGVVCRRERTTGSHISKRVCRTRAEMELQRQADQDMIRGIQRTPQGTASQ